MIFHRFLALKEQEQNSRGFHLEQEGINVFVWNKILIFYFQINQLNKL